MSPCPDVCVLRELAEGRLEGAEFAAVEAHVEGCPTCQTALEQVGASTIEFPFLRGRGGACPARLPRVPGYELIEEVGSGGMGVVYRARHLRLCREVALKMVRGRAPDDRFRREAQTLARLRHPNVVQVYEVGEADGCPFFAMELVPGGSLRGRGPLEPAAAAALVEVLARAMHEAHRLGVVHRDLKPGNVLLGADGTPKVADFGLARDLLGDESLTPTGAVVGTPSYMAPEQAEGKGGGAPVGPPADVWALGAILYELLTGEPPFRAATPVETLMKVLTEDPAPPRRLRPGVPRDLEVICLRCLHKAPGRRYASAADLADDLARFARGEPIRGRRTPAWERAAKWARRRPALATAVALAAMLLLGGLAGGLWYHDRYRRMHVEYYAGGIRRWGAWEGVGRLSEADARRRYTTCKAYRRAGRVVRVEFVNGSGHLTDAEGTRTAIEKIGPAMRQHIETSYDYAYDERGRLREEVARDASGRVVWTLHFTTDTRAHYTDHLGYVRPAAGSSAAYVEYEWTAEGLPRRQLYRDSIGRPAPDRSGLFGKENEFDDRGLAVATTYLGEDGRPTARRDGVSSVRRGFDRRGKLVEESYFDLGGHLLVQSDGYARRTLEYDGHGNFIEEAYFGPDGRPAWGRQGYARWRVGYDDGGRLVEVRYAGPRGEPVLCKEGYARMAVVNDERGLAIEKAYYGTDGRPTLHKDGQAGVRLPRDEHGKHTAASYFGLDGKPTLVKDGYAALEISYDERGRIAEVRFLGTDGKPIAEKTGMVWFRLEYDDRGNRTAMTYLEARPGTAPGTSARRMRVTSRYDERGNECEEAYFGPDGKPETAGPGKAYVKVRSSFDERGHKVEETYLGPGDRPVDHPDGYAGFRSRYDARGNWVGQAYSGPDGKPKRSRFGHARWVSSHDGRGNTTRVDYFDEADKPVLHAEGYAGFTAAFDDRGNRVGASYFGTDGKPVRLPSGYSRWAARHDERGNQTEERYFGPTGEPCLCSFGHAGWTARHDDHDRPVEYSYFGTDGKPCPHTQGYVRYTIRYDRRGNRCGETYFGPDGKPVRSKHGYARWEARFDERGRRTHSSNFDEAGKEYARAFDEDGRVIEEAWRDPDGRLARVPGGYSRRTYGYDERGNSTAGATFDADGRPFPLRGWCGFTATYDARGNQTSMRGLGPDGKAALHDDGYASYRKEYNDRSALLSLTLLDLAGKPVRHRARGYARVEYRLDPAGRRAVDAKYLDELGRPVRTGLFVTTVDAGSAAGRAGLRVGDRLLSFFGAGRLTEPRLRHLLGAIAAAGEKGPVAVRLARGAEEKLLTVPPGPLGIEAEDRALGEGPAGAGR